MRRRYNTKHLTHTPAEKSYYGRKSSAEASQTFRRRRSNDLEKVLHAIAHGADHDKAVTATVAQKSDTIRQNKNTFFSAANSAGIKIFSSFTLDEMASLSTKLPLRTFAAKKTHVYSIVWL